MSVRLEAFVVEQVSIDVGSTVDWMDPNWLYRPGWAQNLSGLRTFSPHCLKPQLLGSRRDEVRRDEEEMWGEGVENTASEGTLLGVPCLLDIVRMR